MDLRLGRVLTLCLLGLLCGCAVAPRPVQPSELEGMRRLAGVVTGKAVYSGEVYMADDVLVPAESTLVLRSGTVVYVRSAEGTQIDPEYLSSLTELLVRGRLRIEGTERRPVWFVPLQVPNAGEPAWAGIALIDAGSSSIAGARISHAETAVLAIGSSPEIRHNHLQFNRYGVIAQEGSAPLISDNRIEKGEGGIFCWRQSHPRILGNRVFDHGEEGIFIDADSRPTLAGNLVSGNDLGLVFYQTEPAGELSGVQGNRENLRRVVSPSAGRP